MSFGGGRAGGGTGTGGGGGGGTYARKSLGGGLGIGALAGGAGIDVTLLGALGAAALGLLERAGLGDLASATSPFATNPCPKTLNCALAPSSGNDGRGSKVY